MYVDMEVRNYSGLKKLRRSRTFYIDRYRFVETGIKQIIKGTSLLIDIEYGRGFCKWNRCNHIAKKQNLNGEFHSVSREQKRKSIIWRSLQRRSERKS